MCGTNIHAGGTFFTLCVQNFTAGAGREHDGAHRLDWFTIGSFYEAIGHKLEGEALLTINRRAVEKMILYAKKIMILLEKQHNDLLKFAIVWKETKRTAKLRRQHDSKTHSY